MRVVVIAKSLNLRGLPRLSCLGCFHSVIASSSIQNVSEPQLTKELLYLGQLVVW
ncbi:hypothetical protein VCRA2119O147_330060 [Vibrio crassostreae]|nr:hypothetical protein EDB58_11252 [Vibrio crassostreae]TCL18823.1 hypothetical protein EDB52_11742 [Vibrio crassostreae]TCN96069.1 hypothetical protein EDB30_11951 [Vibrio crassostreae]TCT45372.1 hypothetical protein EDB39_11942 [Vibrio crassostreae]TCT46686.1 hypothetical protein EDB42_12042 [Vibrio crassostreae]